MLEMEKKVGSVDFMGKVLEEKSLQFSKGFEPLYVEEDEGEFERLCYTQEHPNMPTSTPIKSPTTPTTNQNLTPNGNHSWRRSSEKRLHSMSPSGNQSNVNCDGKGKTSTKNNVVSGGRTASTTSPNTALPPIPPTTSTSAPAASPPSKPIRPSLAIKTRFKSPSRKHLQQQPQASSSAAQFTLTLDDLNAALNQSRRYARSLPDNERLGSPVAFDVNSFLGQGKPNKFCRNKHKWAKKEEDRHSSYIPGGGTSAAYKELLYRPLSPFDFCRTCATKTLPRAAHHGLCVCCLEKDKGELGYLGGSMLGLDYEGRLQRLETDKETLHLQVSVLSDQIDVQTEKIKDLEKCLDDKRCVLENTEDHLQRELLSRSSLETQKLQLMTELSGLRLKQAALERENLELKERHYHLKDKKPPTSPSRAPSPQQKWFHNNFVQTPAAFEVRTVPRSTRNIHGSSTGNGNVPPPPPPPTHFYSLQRAPKNKTNPGFCEDWNKDELILMRNNHHHHYPPHPALPFHFKDAQDLKGIPGFQTFQIPAQQEGLVVAGDRSAPALHNHGTSGNHKARGIMRIFEKIRRSNSGGVCDKSRSSSHYDPTTFPSTKIHSQPQPTDKMPEGHMSSWDSEGISQWLNFMGLGQYSSGARKWVKSGQQLLNATPSELERDLGVKNHFHKKKLLLAVDAWKGDCGGDAAGKLDHHWVSRWLDDLGLPQYKEAFLEARIDGRLLNLITTEELISLKVVSALHHASLKWGIWALRLTQFRPDSLIRREGGFPQNDETNGIASPVTFWTNHRVMEWLRSIDLAEYAPNLRGSGVHGGLLLLEKRFNAELLSNLLAIPLNKTLLRRHLSLQVNELIGKGAVQTKRQAEQSVGFVPLCASLKVKSSKKGSGGGPFLKRRQHLENEELLCPIIHAPELLG